MGVSWDREDDKPVQGIETCLSDRKMTTVSTKKAILYVLLASVL